ncbi:ABC transporter ATP-binding protein [Clostridium thermobutyricum]|uniref:Putative ABC transporter ATP-binding protein n=1 Tax=Clostridium thermobutyricum DSM 4928 TaxID=1121339 RepID=A0A1V4ST37_9CLOT|nr:ABC transporter ATP-binding protein [Clostridium thermobutyricum]OPX47022.1 putative ABC transporter ATP-binding protein [Clostridium thermobutyricum DSM 4928]
MIKVEGLSKIYGKGETKVEALKNINLKIKKGEIIAIIGESGSGKSTLLHMIGGVDKPTSGKVYLNGVDFSKLKDKKLGIIRRRNIGFVFQEFNLLSSLTVEENIDMPVLLDKGKVDKEYKKELISMLHLNGKENSLPSQLSGGQQQRVAIGRALSNKPDVILADEPTGNLDSKTSKEIISLLKYSCKKYNQTLIMITHDISITDEVDRIIKIEDGEIVLDKYR